MTTTTHEERDRLLRDLTAADELLAWARRHDDACAEAIALARLGPDGGQRRWTRIAARVDALEPDADLLDTLDAELAGWPDDLRVAPPTWIWPGPRPPLRLARVACFGAHLAEVQPDALTRWLASPHTRALTALDLDGQPLDDETLEVLCEAAHLRRLGLFQTELTIDGVGALAQSALAGRLCALDLGANPLDTEDFGVPLGMVLSELIDAIAHPDGLDSLGLSELDLTEQDTDALLAAPSTRRLAELDLSANEELGDEVAYAIANTPTMTALRSLDLRDTSISIHGLRLLCASPALASLQRLTLPGELDGEVLAVLSTATFVDSLRHLELTGDDLSEPVDALVALVSRASLASLVARGLDGPTLRAMAARGRWGALERIELDGNDALTGEDLVALLEAVPGSGLSMSVRLHGKLGRAIEPLAASPALQRVCALHLDGNLIGDAGVQALARSPYANHLEVLSLRNNRLGPDAITALADSPHLTALTSVDLAHNELGDAGLERLLASPRLAAIAQLGFNALSQTGEQRLQAWRASRGQRGNRP